MNGNADLNYPFSVPSGPKDFPVAECERIGKHWFTGPHGKRTCHRCGTPEPK
jgi:hypothetical protein